ncbi:MAG: hypothetical protein WCW44_01140 [archaeon]|jgi:hypothetical protein
MQRKRNIPQLAGSRIKKQREIFEGRTISARRITLVERTGRIRKLVLRKPVSFMHNPQRAIDYQTKWEEFKKVGLPVPDYSKVDLRKGSPTYLGIFQPDLEKRYGKLIPINNTSYEGHNGRPHFLKQLKLGRDRRVLGELASDLSKLHELNYVGYWVDYWHFYKKGNSYGRLMIDLEELYKRDLTKSRDSQVASLIHMFQEFKVYLGEKEFDYFVNQYIKHCKYKPRSELVADFYRPKPADYYSWREYKKRERAEKLHPKIEQPLFV